MRPHSFALLLIAVLLFGSRPCLAQWDGGFVFTEKEALVVGTRENIPGTGVRRAEWSPDSRFVLFEREQIRLRPNEIPPPLGQTGRLSSEAVLSIWSAASHATKDIWRGPSGAQTISIAGWLPGTATAIAVVDWSDASVDPPIMRKSLIRLDAAHGSSTQATEISVSAYPIISPNIGLAAIASASERRVSIQFIGNSGMGSVVALPPTTYAFGVPMYWIEGGRKLAVGLSHDPPGARPSPPQDWYRVDPATGSVTKLQTRPERSTAAERESLFNLRQTATEVQDEKAHATVHPVWLEAAEQGDKSRTLVYGDAEFAEAAPDGSAVLVATKGAAVIVPILRRPKAVVLAALAAREARTCKANMAAICAAQSAFALRYGQFSADPMSPFNPADPVHGGIIGTPEGLVYPVTCPSGGSYVFSLEDGKFTVSCPNGDHHAEYLGVAADYRKTMNLSK